MSELLHSLNSYLDKKSFPNEARQDLVFEVLDELDIDIDQSEKNKVGVLLRNGKEVEKS